LRFELSLALINLLKHAKIRLQVFALKFLKLGAIESSMFQVWQAQYIIVKFYDTPSILIIFERDHQFSLVITCHTSIIRFIP